MAGNYIDKWNANGQEYDIQDAGRGLPLGVATLDNNGRIPYEQLPESAVEFKGYWNANTNTPHLADGTGVKGDMYYVDVAGSQDLGSGAQYFNVGDRVLYDGNVWKNINSTAVKSVNSVMPNAQGNVALPTKIISIDSTLAVTGAPTISVGDTVKALFTANITGANDITAMSISYNGTSYTVKVPKEGLLSDFVATELTTGTFTYIDAYKYVEFMLNSSDQLVIIGNPLVLSGEDYEVYADGKVGNEPVGAVRALSTVNVPYGWAEGDGAAIDRNKHHKLFTKYSTEEETIGGVATKLINIYGVGDGSTTFNLPDYREVALVGVGQNSTDSDLAAHDTYTVGKFKDDQLCDHQHDYYMNTPSVGVSGLEVNVKWGDSGWTSQVTTANIHANRSGTTTRGKRKGVKYIVKVL